MSTSALRSITSPTSVVFKNASIIAPRSILKRPASLPLSPNPFQAGRCISFVVSPAATSPHVRFPNSATLVSIFSAHSPNTYDRAAIVVSPNPLAMPAWGDRVYSPASGVFKSSATTKAASLSRPVLSVTFADSLPVPPKAAVMTSTTRAGARFRENIAKSAQTLPREETGATLGSFPRSPYPSDVMSPATKTEIETEVVQSRPRSNSLEVPRADTPRSQSISFRTNSANDLLSPVMESPMISVSPETRLSNAFWASLTVAPPKSILKNKTDAVKVNDELDVPVSAVPRFGALWSPGLPRKSEAMLSPSTRTSFGPTSRELLSPAPVDRVASFPTFGAVLSFGDAVAYPSPIIKEASN